ncbi:MAG: tRNA (guanine) methyltransferase Trm5 [Lasallia pustulata]|uniref:tRNA (guanine(37)-N1)-methyltransferase n=1 Tax=Lasallia pustulata TaxID=136370 RepID=A0A5M8PJF7_9LECA|nr:MAG: tRNA (guanine) methyltransferase Trm5 [Lasallia pustulata]
MFRPPVNRAMRQLDRSFFQKRIPLAAARVLDTKQISNCISDLSEELLYLERCTVVRPGPMDNDLWRGRKALLLRPRIKPHDASTWTPTIHQLIEKRVVDVAPWELELNYDYWTYQDIMHAIIPEDEQGELPTGFSIVGHVAHLNLRKQYLPYKDLLATVLLDKNPTIRTVINKIDDVGTENEYRTFDYELLAGKPDLNVEVKEEDCIFRFDYSKVYWNSRLNTEHRRLVEMFQEGEAVCDVMAGVGPFAVPAGKKKVFVWANDLNPNSYASLGDAIKRNKVHQFVKAFNEDGRAFIRNSAAQLLKERHDVDVTPKQAPRRRRPLPKKLPRPPKQILKQPNTFNHYVMNLPATATTFLDAFIGLYRGHETIFSPHTANKLPMVHVHCFSTKSDDNKEEKIKICQAISSRLGHEITPEDSEVEIWDVRDVAPNKRMFCASFRLPAAVAFRDI